ncbi:MAG: hypothetical protein IKQ25_13265 [Lachnospiraceae bacterium]|nr:hypothetical protein [Lachnospiraceae bacterium]
MEKLWSLRKDNRGASLIAVLISLAVVSVMGIIIAQITVTNIQMKEVERQSKTNFYDAERVMDDLTSGLNGFAATAMETAYNDMLGQYRKVTAEGATAKEIFARKYLDNMKDVFDAGVTGKEPLSRMISGTTKPAYTRGYYSIAKVKSALSKDFTGTEYTDDQRDEFVKIAAPDAGAPDCAAYYHVDYENMQFILEGIKVSVKDKNGNIVNIMTDLVFHVPEINIDGSNLVKEFMRYSLIADTQISVGSTGINVDGNVYAGHEGIVATGNSQANFTGKKIITRGDITVMSKGQLNFGRVSDLTNTQIWAENIKTERTPGVAATSDNRPKLGLYGYTFVSDDLELNGAYDEVKIAGDYYGYNFQKNYNEKVLDLQNAEYSSAVVINGKEINLDLTGIKTLMIAGRTFIGRNTGTVNAQDIAMGESLAVRSNQIAYYVPQGCVDAFNSGDVALFNSLYEEHSGVPNVYSYLVASEPFTTFYYKTLDVAPEVIYYLNFASDQKANDFYVKYYNNRKGLMNAFAENYLHADALKLNNDVALLLQGALLYRNGSTGKLDTWSRPIDANLWGYDKHYYKFAGTHALMYKALATTLEDKTTGLTLADARLVDDVDNRMFQYLIDETALNALVTSSEATGTDQYVVAYTDPEGAISGTKLLAIVKGDYEVDSVYDGGLVIATGNVRVNSASFSGTIIAKGIISFATNAGVSSDEILVSQIISQDVRKTIPKFATIFKGYEAAADSVMSTATINKYLAYENWTKTID